MLNTLDATTTTFAPGLELSLELTRVLNELSCIIVPDNEQAEALEEQLTYLLPDKKIARFADLEILPYDTFSPAQDIISARLNLLHSLLSGWQGIVIVAAPTLAKRLPPPEFLLQRIFKLQVGQQITWQQLSQQLGNGGYSAVSTVLNPGEFAIRGSLIDLYPMGATYPYRIDFLDSSIDSIRSFNPDTQRTINKEISVELLPAHEFPLDDEGISTFRLKFRERFAGNPQQSNLYQDVSNKMAVGGLEYYLPLFFASTASFFDYLPAKTTIYKVGPLMEAMDKYYLQAKERYNSHNLGASRPLLLPQEVFFPTNELFALMKKFAAVQFLLGEVEANITIQQLPEFLANNNYKIIFSVETEGRLEVLKELLVKFNLKPKLHDHLLTAINSSDQFNIVLSPFLHNVTLKNAATIIITEASLLGHKVPQKKLKRHKNYDEELALRSIAELTPGQPVVHIEHGVGRYLGLSKLKLSTCEGEFITLEYAQGDKIYVPVMQLQLISRYAGFAVDNAPLHKLGGSEWQKIKKKAFDKIHDTACELLEIYAKRQAKPGLACSVIDDSFKSFCETFPFTLTFDQEKAINEVISDMQSSQAMDRVICGDVGFGKTEVALRAAMLAVINNKQVAILVPTTLLAEQHLQTFRDRFAHYPVKVAAISRFKTAKEQQAVLQGLAQGSIDIVIGTHKLLQEINFKNLGLLIIDEEHRFGVRQKEAIKKLRTEVDILTLTATPIPRTLNMALAGIRDLSIIATPPQKRLSIKTFVQEKNDAVVTDAILREINRGGQVYYLYNSVETIENRLEQLQQLAPFARISVAHGQMSERNLERVMYDFYHKKYNVLLCTTIIETGIDIPSANTIIIERADKFGLAQLHQLRGRVGRSHHQAYAFCLTPPLPQLTSDSKKRLEALARLDELGSGFSLASQDLEIRGAGELLGEAQSGDMHEIGYSLYMELLEQAVKAVKEGRSLGLEPARAVEVDLQIPALIPDSLIPDVYSRLLMYKRLTLAKDSNGLSELKVEMIDRFGALPEAASNLFILTELKLKAQELGIKKIELHGKGGRCEFTTKPNVEPIKIITLIQQQSHVFKLDGANKIKFTITLETAAERINFIVKFLNTLGLPAKAAQ